MLRRRGPGESWGNSTPGLNRKPCNGPEITEHSARLRGCDGEMDVSWKWPPEVRTHEVRIVF